MKKLLVWITAPLIISLGGLFITSCNLVDVLNPAGKSAVGDDTGETHEVRINYMVEGHVLKEANFSFTVQNSLWYARGPQEYAHTDDWFSLDGYLDIHTIDGIADSVVSRFIEDNGHASVYGGTPDPKGGTWYRVDVMPSMRTPGFKTFPPVPASVKYVDALSRYNDRKELFDSVMPLGQVHHLYVPAN